MNSRKRVFILLALLGVSIFGVWMIQKRYIVPKKELETAYANTRRAINERERDVERLSGVRRRLVAFSQTTLGNDPQTVTAALRAAINELVAASSAKIVTVSTSNPRGVLNPAAEARVLEYRSRDVSRRPDFLVIDASLRAEGTLEQLARVAATVESQAWTHRVTGLQFAPKGRERDVFELSMDFSTVFIPDIPAPSRLESNESLWAAADPASLSAWSRLWSVDPFNPPVVVAQTPPETERRPRPPQPPPPPPPPAYGEWRITGVVNDPQNGPELWLVNTRTNDFRRLTVGERVLDAEFVSAIGELATIKIGDSPFEVSLNQTLGDRREIPR